MKKLYKLIYIFIITSICGYFVELVWSFVTKGIFINHSAVVIRPFNFVVIVAFCFALTMGVFWEVFEVWSR